MTVRRVPRVLSRPESKPGASQQEIRAAQREKKDGAGTPTTNKTLTGSFSSRPRNKDSATASHASVARLTEPQSGRDTDATMTTGHINPREGDR